MSFRISGTARRVLAVTGALAAVAVLFSLWTRPEERGSSKVSGAYRALSFWGASRAYPGPTIPAGGFSRAWEYSKSMLRRPLSEVFDLDGGMRGGPSGWQELGPKNNGGRTLAIAFDPTNPNVVYAGSASGGLWKSTTGGVGAAAWSRVVTGFPVLGVSSIEFDPGDPAVMYIGTGEIYNHLTAGDLEADRRTRGSYGIGILKTTDGGATWFSSLDWAYNQAHGVWAVRVDPSDPVVIWAATTEGVYKSTDAGISWTQKLSVVMAMDLRIHPTNSGTVLAGCGDLGSTGRGIYRTTDGGGTWTQVTGGGIPPDFEGKIQFGVTPADVDLVFASIGNGFEYPGTGTNATWLFRSTDFGATWTLRNTTDYSLWQGWYSHDVAIHPTNPDTLICVGLDIWKSTDSGATLIRRSDWSTYYSGVLPPGGPEGGSNYSHADHHEAIWHPTDPATIYFGNDGGVFRSTDGGQTFHGLNGGYQATQFYNGTSSHPTDPNLFMGGLQDNSSCAYRGGAAWQVHLLGGDGGWTAIDGTNPNILYGTAQWLYMGRSTNAGASWSIISPPDLGGPTAFIAPMLISPTNPQVIYAGSNYLFKTFDAGGLWYIGQGGTEIDGNPILLLAVAQDNDDVLYLATYPYVTRGKVHVTTDGGSTFTEITGPLPDRYPGDMIVDPTDEATVYLTMSGFGSSHVFRSTDYGASWTDLDGGTLPDVPTTAVAVDPLFPEHVYVGSDVGVYFTADNGQNWVELDLGLPEATLVSDLSVSPVNRKLRAATHGHGAYERDLLGAAVDAPHVVRSTGSLVLHPSAPNPFRGTTAIRFQMPRAGHVQLNVYDVRGALVRMLVDERRQAGSHRVSWDGYDSAGRRAAAGTYFYRLRTGGESATGRVVLLK